MALEPDKLLVLKAFYMGRAIATRPRGKSDAIRMIDTAISQLQNSNDSRSQVRLLFYLLLKSEALRGDLDIVALRKHAKTIAERIGGHTYQYFMALEEATQTRKKIYGVELGIIADKGIQTGEDRMLDSDLSSQEPRNDLACRALGVDRTELSTKELHFLHKISLKALLDQHGIEHAS